MINNIHLINKIISRLATLRFVEITGKMGFIFIGAIFAFPELSRETFTELLFLYCLCLFLGLSIYSLNSYLGYNLDLVNSRLSVIRNSSRAKIGWYALLFTIVALVILYYSEGHIRIVALLMIIIWGVYALPNIGLKSIPVTGLLVAFVAQILHFHLGYLPFASFDNYSLKISIYFALLFSAGHALHEVIDYVADKEAKINTSAVFYGQRRLELTSIILFTGAGIYWVALYFKDTINLFQATCYATALILQLITWFIIGSRYFAYRRLYLVYYFLATAAICIEYYWLW